MVDLWPMHWPKVVQENRDRVSVAEVKREKIVAALERMG